MPLQDGDVWEPPPSAPDSSLTVSSWSLERMQGAIAGCHLYGHGRLGLVGEWQHTTLLHEVREQDEQSLIDTEDFPY